MYNVMRGVVANLLINLRACCIYSRSTMVWIYFSCLRFAFDVSTSLRWPWWVQS